MAQPIKAGDKLSRGIKGDQALDTVTVVTQSTVAQKLTDAITTAEGYSVSIIDDFIVLSEAPFNGINTFVVQQ